MAATDVEVPGVPTLVGATAAPTEPPPVDAPIAPQVPTSIEPDDDGSTRRRRWPIPVAVALVAALVGVVVWLLWPEAPQPPESVRVESTRSESVTLLWDTPTGPDVESYVVLDGEVEMGSVSAPETSVDVTGLTPNTRYELTVVSVDGDRRSEPSDAIAVRTLPGAPVLPEITGSTATSVELRWEAPPGPDVESYAVLDGEDELASVSAPETSVDVTGLTPNTRYELTVVSVDGDRRSESSYVIGVTTDPGAPIQPREVGSSDVTSAELQWNVPPGPFPDMYVVSDGVDELAIVRHPETSVVIPDLIPGASYSFSVTARSGVRESVPAVITVPVMAPSPTDLASDPALNTIDTVVLTWVAPADAGPATEYLVSRDGVPVATVPGDTFTYTDAGLAPATAYEYRIAATWGYEPSEPTDAITVSTAEPPVADGRLAGPWPVNLTTVDDPGGNLDVGTTWTSSWRFEPSCEQGACDVTLVGDHSPPGYGFKGFSVDLVRDGATYSGSSTASITYCDSEPVDNTVSVLLTVDAAGPGDGTWMATSWTGTLEISSPYTEVGQYYCPPQRIEEGLTAAK